MLKEVSQRNLLSYIYFRHSGVVQVYTIQKSVTIKRREHNTYKLVRVIFKYTLF